jgi:hypothetical protein
MTEPTAATQIDSRLIDLAFPIRTMPFDSDLCIIQHDPNKTPTQRLKQPFGI